jgi:Aspartyl protease
MYRIILSVFMILVNSCSLSTGSKKKTIPNSLKGQLNYESGNVSEAMKQFETIRAVELTNKYYYYKNLEVLSLYNLIKNKPETVLKLKSLIDINILKFRAYAAWRVGDIKELNKITPFLKVFNSKDNEVLEIIRMARISSLIKNRILRKRGVIVENSSKFDLKEDFPVIKVEAHKKNYNFIFDTGSEITVIDRFEGEKLGVLTEVLTENSSNGLKKQFGIIPELKVLGVTFYNIPCVVMDLSKLPQDLNIAGVLSVQDLFSKDIIRIDYKKGNIQRVKTAPSGGEKIYFIYGNPFIGIEGKLNGGQKGLFFIDTGMKKSGFSLEYIKYSKSKGAKFNLSGVKLKRKIKDRNKHILKRYIHGGKICFRKICSTLIKNPVVENDKTNKINLSGVLGFEIFKNRTIIFDFPKMKLHILK